MRKVLVTALVTCSIAGAGAATAQAADYATNKATATWTATKDCARYTGCSSLTLMGNVNGGGECSAWDFRYHTTYYGWISRRVNVDAAGGPICLF